MSELKTLPVNTFAQETGNILNRNRDLDHEFNPI